MVDLQKIFDEIDGVVEHVVVGAAHVDAELAAEFGAERGPVALENVAQVVVFFPVGGDFRIDVAGFLIENLLGITVRADWAVDGLPDVELFAGARVVAESELVLIGALRGGDGVAEIVAIVRAAATCVCGPCMKKAFLSFVEIDVGVGAEIDRIGASDERAVVMIGIKHLHGDGFPSAGGAAVNEASPALADGAKLLFERGD